MLEEFLKRLCDELSLTHPTKMKEKNTFSFHFATEVVTVKDLEPGISLNASISPCLKKRREELFIRLMRANLLGQATGNTRIGIDNEEKTLTLSLGLPYELDYQAFRKNVEDFINYLIYWREEIAKFDNEPT